VAVSSVFPVRQKERKRGRSARRVRKDEGSKRTYQKKISGTMTSMFWRRRREEEEVSEEKNAKTRRDEKRTYLHSFDGNPAFALVWKQARSRKPNQRKRRREVEKEEAEDTHDTSPP